jgi:hypothetical protein
VLAGGHERERALRSLHRRLGLRHAERRELGFLRL